MMRVTFDVEEDSYRLDPQAAREILAMETERLGIVRRVTVERVPAETRQASLFGGNGYGRNGGK